MRSVLQETGIPQTSAFQGNIGPFPNMQTAMQKVYNNYLLEVKSNTKPTFSIAPNPATNFLNIVASPEFSEGSSVAVYNNLGQKVLSSNLNQQAQIDVSNLLKGVYFVQINSKNGFSATQKVVKQ